MRESTAAALIREARQRAGLRQAWLARRAGLPRSVLNAYERGRRQPSAEMLTRVVRAAGFDLKLVPSARRADAERAGRLLSHVLDLAESLPTRRRRQLGYPPFARRVRAPSTSR